jgi:hypothetical protein
MGWEGRALRVRNRAYRDRGGKGEKLQIQQGIDSYLSFGSLDLYPRYGGDLDRNNPNLKQMLKINLWQKNFTRLTLFCRAIHGGAANEGAAPLPVARHWLPRRHGGPRSG